MPGEQRPELDASETSLTGWLEVGRTRKAPDSKRVGETSPLNLDLARGAQIPTRPSKDLP